MKKLLLTIIAIVFIPIQILACPHFDENGNLYYMFYDTDDYSVTVKVFPRDYHNHIYYYNEDGVKIREKIEVYLHADYSFYNLEENVKVDVSNQNELNFNFDQYSFNIPIKKAYLNSRAFLNDNILSIFYGIETTPINEINDEETNSKINKIFKSEKIEKKEVPILKISPSIMIQTTDYIEENEMLDEFIEPINVSFEIKDVNPNLYAILIEETIDYKYKVTKIDGIYDEENKQFKFNIEKTGIYTVINELEDFDSFEFDPEEGIIDSTEKNSSLYIFALIAFILIIGTIFLLKNKE